jgi:hypothetical protein
MTGQQNVIMTSVFIMVYREQNIEQCNIECCMMILRRHMDLPEVRLCVTILTRHQKQENYGLTKNEY